MDNYVFAQGVHNGKTYRDVRINHTGYFIFLASQPTRKMYNYIDFIAYCMRYLRAEEVTRMPVSLDAVPVSHAAVPVSHAAVPVSQAAVPVSQAAVPVSQAAVPVSHAAVPVSHAAVPVSHAAVPFWR